MLKEHDLFEDKDKIKIAIERLRHFEPPEGYYLAFSGGKDSIVIKELANMAGVKYDAHYNLTTIDPPELVHFIRDYHKDVIIDKPEKQLLKRMLEVGIPPQRQRRWCCQEYKERGGLGRFVITGIRKAESNNRKNRRMIEVCFRDNTKKFMNVIIDWLDIDVWEFIRKYKIPYCKLYDEGWKRIGCLFCPFVSTKNRLRELELYPGFKKQFMRAFKVMFEDDKTGYFAKTPRWKNGEEYFWWWINDNRQSYNKDQMVIFE